MAAKVLKGEQLKPGTIMVYSNEAWKPIKGTPWEGLERERKFRQHLHQIAAGKATRYHDHSFLMVLPQ